MIEKSIKLLLAPLVAFYSYLPEKISSIIEVPCLFKSMLGCECPGCGITRGIKSILNLNIDTSLKYHKLSIFVLLIIIYLSLKEIYLRIKKNKDVRIYNS